MKALTEGQIAYDAQVQISLAFSPLNLYYANERYQREFGRAPTDEEIIMHFIEQGGSQQYRLEYAT